MAGPDITIREATAGDPPAIARVHVDAWRTTYRGMVPDSYLEGLSYDSRERMWNRIITDPNSRSKVHVAEDVETGRVVGFISYGPSNPPEPRYSGEVYAIYVLEDYQGHGIGRKLMQAAVARLAALGMHSLKLWVMAENPARHFYEALGGQAAGEQEAEVGGVTVREISYGWNDTRSMQ